MILQYYAIFCLAFSPVSIVILIILYKKTNLLERIDAMVDKILGVKTSKQSKPDKESNAKEKEDKKETEDNPALSGIAFFKLPVGEIYYCRQTSQSRGGDIYEAEWSTDNEYIGKVNEKGLFTSTKVGTINIYCSRKGDMMAPAALAYTIEVTPVHRLGAEKFLLDVSKREKKATILANNITKKIVLADTAKNTVTYKEKGEITKSIYKFDKSNQLQGAVVFFSQMKKARREEFLSGLEERFEEIPLAERTSPLMRVFVHRLIDEVQNEIDVFACLWETKDGLFILGISQSWREYGEAEEFLMNISMAPKCFEDCLPADYISKIHVEEGFTLSENTDTAEKHNNVPAQVTEPPKEKADETSSRETHPEDNKDTEHAGDEENPDAASDESQNDTPASGDSASPEGTQPASPAEEFTPDESELDDPEEDEKKEAEKENNPEDESSDSQDELDNEPDYEKMYNDVDDTLEY